MINELSIKEQRVRADIRLRLFGPRNSTLRTNKVWPTLKSFDFKKAGKGGYEVSGVSLKDVQYAVNKVIERIAEFDGAGVEFLQITIDRDAGSEAQPV